MFLPFVFVLNIYDGVIKKNLNMPLTKMNFNALQFINIPISFICDSVV